MSFLTLLPLTAIAATVTWDNGGGDNLWSTAANWSGDALPSSSDDVVFDDTSTANAFLNTGATIKSLSLSSGYTGTLRFYKNLTVNGDISLAAGTLDMRGSGVTLVGHGDWTNTGGTFES